MNLQMPLNNMRTTQLAMMFALLTCCAVASAQQTVSVEEYFQGMLTLTASQCAAAGDTLGQQYDREGKQLEAYEARSGQKVICGCVPQQLRDLQAKLSKEEKAAKLSEAEIVKKYFTDVLGKCLAEKAHASYSGDCPDRYSKLVAKPAAYCSCMLTAVSKFSHAELVQAGNEASDWIPLAADAKKRGVPPPPQSPVLQRYMGLDSSCRK